MNSYVVVDLYTKFSFFNALPNLDTILSRAKCLHYIKTSSNLGTSFGHNGKSCIPHLEQSPNKHLQLCNSSNSFFGQTTTSHNSVVPLYILLGAWHGWPSIPQTTSHAHSHSIFPWTMMFVLIRFNANLNSFNFMWYMQQQVFMSFNVLKKNGFNYSNTLFPTLTPRCTSWNFKKKLVYT